ncbi:MAG: helix-turn-helix domain-containing protein [Planctomycetota bacterium]
MANSRAFNRNLSRILSRTDAPVYVIEGERIAFANQALLQLIELEPDDLKDARCVYCSETLEDTIENRIRGLAPPPDVSEHGFASFKIFVGGSDSSLDTREAIAVPIPGQTGSEPAVLIFADSTAGTNGTFQDRLRAFGHSGIEFEARELHIALAETNELINVRFSKGNLLGNSSFARILRRKLDIAARTDASVLITGPTGSGKEHFARTIFSCRTQEGRVDTAPVVIDCPVADPELVQRTLRESRRSNDGGALETPLLLLDIDRLAPAAQLELLGFFELPGANFPVIATSTSTFAALLESKRFDETLARILHSVSIDLIPLRERIEDIPPIAQAFLERLNATLGAQPRSGFSSTVLQMFTDYHWPLNLDELESVVRQSAAGATGPVVEVTDLPRSFRDALSARDLERPEQVEINLAHYLESIEKELIARAMQHSGGNKAKASRLLGISRPKLLRRLQATGLSRDAAAVEDDFIDSSEFEEADD